MDVRYFVNWTMTADGGKVRGNKGEGRDSECGSCLVSPSAGLSSLFLC